MSKNKFTVTIIHYQNYLKAKFIGVDDGEGWNIVDNTITGNTWLYFTKNNKNKLNKYFAPSGEYILVYSHIAVIFLKFS